MLSQHPFEIGKSVMVRQGKSKSAIVSLGSILPVALQAADELLSEGIEVTVISARFAKPIDEEIISLVSEQYNVVTVEDHSLACGFGSAVLEQSSRAGSAVGGIFSLGLPDEFIEAAERGVQLEEAGISVRGIVEAVKRLNSSGLIVDKKKS